jgi:hypothetical protein
LNGHVEEAARLFGATSALRDRIGHPLSPADRPAYERDIAALRTALGEEAFSAAWEEGRAMSLDPLRGELKRRQK